MEEKKFTIYLHRCPNGKCYVGMTSQKVSIRWGTQGQKYKNNKNFYPDIEKYGWDNIEHIILEENLSKEDACESEKYNIKKYNCIYPNGYNLSIGGDLPSLGLKRSEETKEKLRVINTGKKLSEETKKKIGLRSKGKNNYFYGKNHSGQNGAMFGIKGVLNPRSKKCCIDGIIFNSLNELSKYLKMSQTVISNHLTEIRRPMPQKWKDRGLRYYNPETDSHLPIYVDTKDEV